MKGAVQPRRLQKVRTAPLVVPEHPGRCRVASLRAGAVQILEGEGPRHEGGVVEPGLTEAGGPALGQVQELDRRTDQNFQLQHVVPGVLLDTGVLDHLAIVCREDVRAAASWIVVDVHGRAVAQGTVRGSGDRGRSGAPQCILGRPVRRDGQQAGHLVEVEPAVSQGDREKSGLVGVVAGNGQPAQGGDRARGPFRHPCPGGGGGPVTSWAANPFVERSMIWMRFSLPITT